MPTSDLGQGRYVASEWDMLWYPKGYQFDHTIIGVVYCHGAGELAASPLNSTAGKPKEAALLSAIASIFPVISFDGGIFGTGTETDSDSFGSLQVVTRVGQAITRLQGAGGAKTGKVHLVGFSMGHVTSMNYAQQNAANVASIVGILPVNDLDDIRDNNRGGFRAGVSNPWRTVHSGCSTNSTATITDASIRTADLGCAVSGTNIPASSFVGTVTNGVSYLLSSSASSQVNVNASGTGSALTHTLLRTWVSTGRPGLPAGANPAIVANQTNLNMPQKLWAANDDAICTIASATTLVANLGAPAVLVNMGNTGGHTDATIGAAPIADVLTFLLKNS